MKSILILPVIAVSVFLAGCAGQSNKSETPQGTTLNQIQFKCDAIKEREASTYITEIAHINNGDILMFATRDTCTGTMGSIFDVNVKASTFVVKGDGFEEKLRVDQVGHIVGATPSATEALAKTYYVLGVLTTKGLFKQ
jgi:hypothetical protein